MDGLIYRWTLALQYNGGSSYLSFPRGIQSDWKPILSFVKPGKSRLGGQFPHDMVKAMASDVENKEKPRWGQDKGAVRDLLGEFADPGMVVCDPFVAARHYGYRCV